MFAQTLSVHKSASLLLKHLILLNLSRTEKKMSTLENVIDGLNDVRRRVKEATKRGVQVPTYLFIITYFGRSRELKNVVTTVFFFVK